jgi:serine/threonine protein kinase
VVRSSEVLLPQGTLVGGWQVHDRLGRGGQGSVWSAKPAKTKRTPARALKTCFAEDAQARARFAREAQLLALCDSPYVLKLYEQDLEFREHVPGLPAFAYYVCEKCRGSLEERQRDLGDARQRLALFRQACAAVSYLHGLPQPVIHRDLKPANFLIGGESNSLVLCDFGIARLASSSSLTELHEVVGSQHYRAPEVANGAASTFRSDVYSLGRVLEWMLTGEVSDDLGCRAVPRGLHVDDDACELLDRVIVKATQAQPQNRFSSVKELIDQLPELWLSAKPQPSKSIPVAIMSPAKVVGETLKLVRANDALSLRQLEQQLRRESVPRILQWRAEVGHPGSFSPQDLTDQLLATVEARLALALAAAYAERPGAAETRRLIEDLTSIPGWEPGGYGTIVYAPRTMVYLVHYLHGALNMSLGQLEACVQVAEAPVPSEDGSDLSPLWKDRGLTGYPGLLGDRLDTAWNYVMRLWGRRPELHTMFALESDYQEGLAAYGLILSLMELAEESLQPWRDLTNSRLSVPAPFVRMPHATLARAARRTSGNRAVVKAIASRVGANSEAMQRLWPTWKSLMSKYRGSEFWGGELPLGELAKF